LTPRLLAATIRGVWIVVAALVLLWGAAVGVVRVLREPKNPAPGPPVDISGEEPPAVTSLLVNDFEVTRAAVPATVLDLAARGVIAIDHVGPDHDVIRLEGSAPGALRPYEAAVLDVLRSRAQYGVVPVPALGTGPRQHALGWWRSFRLAVIRDTGSRGLSRDLWDARTLSVLTLLGMLPAPFVALAASDVRAGLAAALLAFVATGWLRATHRQRPTPAGLVAASRWLGVRRMLEGAATIEDVPPSGVVVWERRLAYATAMGLARTVLRTMPMGADLDRRAWSSFGGEWRAVRIRYPRVWPPAWGFPPWAAILGGALLALLGFLALRLALRIGWPADDPLFPSLVVALRVFVAFLGIAGVAVAAWGLPALIRGLLDLRAPRRIVGEVLRIRKRGKSARTYVAIDDGTTDVIRALRMLARTPVAPGLAEYRPATAEVTPSLRHVRYIGPADGSGI
jgi:hypothetical protein